MNEAQLPKVTNVPFDLCPAQVASVSACVRFSRRTVEVAVKGPGRRSVLMLGQRSVDID